MGILSSLGYRLYAVPKTAILVVMGVYLSKGQFDLRAIAVAVLSSLLWLFLYAINEVSDLELEHGKKPRKGLLSTLFFSAAAVVLISALVGWQVSAIMLLMVAGQLAHCQPPMRWKRFPWSGMILTGIVNPCLRLALGVIISVNAQTDWGIVLHASGLILVAHIASAIKTRVYQAERDRRLGYMVIEREFIIKYIEPLQYTTPLFVLATIHLVFILQEKGMMPTPIGLAYLVLVVGLAVAVWKTNDIYDLPRHRGEAAPDIRTMREVWKLRFPASVALPMWQVMAGLAMAIILAGSPVLAHGILVATTPLLLMYRYATRITQVPPAA